jgi:ferredoxin
MVVNKRGIPVPEIIPEVCIGCGACEQICPESAILVYGHKVHRRAQVPEKEEALEISLDGFGF